MTVVIMRFSVQISNGTPAILTELSRGSPQFPKQMLEQYLKLGQNCFLPNPYQLIIHHSSYYLMLYGLDSDTNIKYATINQI
jgi:hypothetical protein